MVDFDPYTPIHELGRQIRAKEISSESLTKFYLDRIHKLDGKLHAFVEVTEDAALAQARSADMELMAGNDKGPLHGIPYAVKDLYDVKGLATRAGTTLLDNSTASENAFVVTALNNQGAVMVGKTHTVQFAYGGVGINTQMDTPFNPWADEHFIPGGSSSGSGVAVGAALVPMALGSDTGGSVRIPASFNGVTGLKTTLGQVSRRGVFPLSWSLDTVGPLTRDVEDARTVFRSLAIFDKGDPEMKVFRQPEEVAKVEELISLQKYKIAYPTNVFFDSCDASVQDSVQKSCAEFAALGAEVTHTEFDVAYDALKLNPKGLVIAAEAYYLNREFVDNHFDKLDPIVGYRLIKGKEVSATQYFDIKHGLDGIRNRALRFFERYDALIVPTVMIPPTSVKHCLESVESYSTTNVNCLRNTAIGNMLNLCGITIPCGFNDLGMPIGLMIYGKPFDEIKIMHIAQAYQQRTRWHLNRPQLSLQKT